MSAALNETHDPHQRSWVASAHAPDGDFPIQNLPFGVFRRRSSDERYRGGVAIGDQVLDLAAAVDAGVFTGEALSAARAAAMHTLNDFMALGPKAWSALRLALSRALRQGSPAQAALQPCLVAMADAEMALPARIGDYTDFFTSIDHAINAGRLFRPTNPLLPNYKWVPIGYHGRASSIVVSGTPVRRPVGQVLPPGSVEPHVQACARLDFELEMGLYVGPGNRLGQPIALDEAETHLFGLCLFNDWSARDIQAWENQPLGPFLAKNFASTVSPWIVTLEALAPYRLPFKRRAGDPSPLPYLDAAGNRAAGALDIDLELLLQTPRMREACMPPASLVRTNYRHAYWTAAQLLAHHTVGGCNLQPGDLLGTGTLSGPTPESQSALLELTQGGREPLVLPHGERRTYLEDGDSVTIRGWCSRPGAARIGFGECAGTVLPARAAA